MESQDHIESEIRNSQNFESQSEINKQKFQIVNQVGIIYTIGAAIISQGGEIYIMIIEKFFSNYFKTNKANVVLIGTLIVNQIIGTTIIFLFTKFIKKITINKKKYGYKKYFANLSINGMLLIIGSIIGYLFTFNFISLYYKNTSLSKDSFIDSSIKKSNKFLTIIVICITGPIAEELIFRKFLIERLAIYSKTLAIFSSGIMFGIFHRNLYQLFGATFVGWAFAYSYVETGNIFIPISYHIIDNSFTVSLMFLYQDNIDINNIRTKIFFILSFIRIINAIVGIIILIIYRKKIKISGEENKSGDKWKFFKSYGMWIFMFEGSILFFYYYSNIL